MPRRSSRGELSFVEGCAEGRCSDEEALADDVAMQHAAEEPAAHMPPETHEQQLARGEEVVFMEAKSKRRITMTLANRDQVVCAVCKQPGHTAGFVGAVYVDCPVKPCYLCKQPGHTTATCPHRLNPSHKVKQARASGFTNVLHELQDREVTPRPGDPRRVSAVPRRPSTWRIRSACLKLLAGRVTALAYPPGSLNLAVAADKKGRVGIWDFDAVNEHTVYSNVHEYQVNALAFLPGRDGMALVSAACDGHVCELDVETGMHRSLANANPDGWVDGVSNERNWRMWHSVATHAARPGVAWAGDNRGQVHCLDVRMASTVWTHAAHAATTKLVSLEVHPFNEHLLLSAGNDKLCKLFDIRMLRKAPSAASGMAPPAEHLIALEHPRVISSASFSPRTGRRLMTTAGDNRIRVWDRTPTADHEPPARELVHSHDFNRYLTPFRAVWDPKDTSERTIVIGRYISEDHGGCVLHPVDILDAGSGALVTSLVDPNLQLINPVNVPHPTMDVIVTGSSGHLYCWRPEVLAGLASATSPAVKSNSVLADPRCCHSAGNGRKWT